MPWSGSGDEGRRTAAGGDRRTRADEVFALHGNRAVSSGIRLLPPRRKDLRTRRRFLYGGTDAAGLRTAAQPRLRAVGRAGAGRWPGAGRRLGRRTIRPARIVRRIRLPGGGQGTR